MAKTVLVVDDDPTQRRLLQGVLERQGFLVAPAEGGDQALEHPLEQATLRRIVVNDEDRLGH